jgi:hypothetical protein
VSGPVTNDDDDDDDDDDGDDDDVDAFVERGAVGTGSACRRRAVAW